MCSRSNRHNLAIWSGAGPQRRRGRECGCSGTLGVKCIHCILSWVDSIPFGVSGVERHVTE